MKRWISSLFACALAGTLVAGCTKSSDNSQQSTGASSESSAAASKVSAAVTEAPAATQGGMQAALGDPAHGQQIFAQNCSSCHGQGGVGGGVGPSLKGEKSRKDFKAAVVWIENPKPPMPKLYQSPLSEKDVDDVAAYVETL